jgi:hypothetical protein
MKLHFFPLSLSPQEHFILISQKHQYHWTQSGGTPELESPGILLWCPGKYHKKHQTK